MKLILLKTEAKESIETWRTNVVYQFLFPLHFLFLYFYILLEI
jgi:hypothetical protein